MTIMDFSKGQTIDYRFKVKDTTTAHKNLFDGLIN